MPTKSKNSKVKMKNFFTTKKNNSSIETPIWAVLDFHAEELEEKPCQQLVGLLNSHHSTRILFYQRNFFHLLVFYSNREFK